MPKIYLLQLRCKPDADTPITPAVSQVSSVLDPQDVCINDNTMAFVFVTGNYNSAEEVLTQYMGIRLGMQIALHFPKGLRPLSPLYIVGRWTTLQGGLRVVVNDNIPGAGFVPHLLGDNYEVVDV